MTGQTENKGPCACGACGKLFGSLSAFDGHRDGPWGDRRCLGDVPMVERGFRLGDDGRWRKQDPRGSWAERSQKAKT